MGGWTLWKPRALKGFSHRLWAMQSLVLALLSLATSAPAGPAIAANLTAAQRGAAVKQITAAIAREYVFTDLRRAVIDRLQTAERAHRYDTEDPTEFAERITLDLQTVSHDGHLYLRNAPSEYAAALAPPESPSGLLAHQQAVAEREHHGLTRLEVLPGNIRYLKISGFRWAPDGTTLKAYQDAAAFLAGGDAIVVDLRGNGGGVSDAADAFTREIVSLGSGGQRPLYFLIDRFVGSAAEAVSYDAKVRKTATLVGATTYGAANNNRKFPIAPQFVLSLSYNRPVHPLTGANWEGVGVAPDIAVAPNLALEAAELDFVTRTLAHPQLDADRRAEFVWLRDRLAAVLTPYAPPHGTLEPLAGTYGPISIRYEGEALRLYRPDRPNWPQGVLLTPMTADGVFAVEGTDDLRIRLANAALQILRPGGAAETFISAQPPR